MVFHSVYPDKDLVQLHLLHGQSHHVQLVVVGQRCFDFQSLTFMSDLYVGYCKFQALMNVNREMKMLRLKDITTATAVCSWARLEEKKPRQL